MNQNFKTPNEEEEFVVVDYEDCSLVEEKLPSTSITSNNSVKNTTKNAERNMNMSDEIYSLRTTSNNHSTTMDEKHSDLPGENLPYDEMIERAEEVVNNILKNIPDEYMVKSDGKQLNDVIEEVGENKHQPIDEFSIFSKNNIENQNDKETEDIFVSDPKPTTTHYVTESTISNATSASPAFENFIENISDNIIDTSTNIVNKITDQTKDTFHNILEGHETDMTKLGTTNYMFEENKPKDNSYFYDEPSHDNVTFSQPSIDMYNHGINELKKTEEGVNEGFSNILFNSQQLLNRNNDLFFNENIHEIPTNINTVISSPLEESHNNNESPINEIHDYHTFEKDLKEEEEIKNYNDMLDFSSTDDQESDEKGNTSPIKDSFERVNIQQTMYSPNIHQQTKHFPSMTNSPVVPENEMTHNIAEFEYSNTSKNETLMTDENEEQKEEELNEQKRKEREAFDMDNISVPSVQKKSNDFHDDDKPWNGPSNENYDLNISDVKGLDKTSDIFTEVSRDDKDYSFDHSSESGLHNVVDDILDRINAAASTAKHTTDQEISPVSEENESNGSPNSQNAPETPDIIDKYENEQYEEEDTPQRNGPLTIPQENKNNDIEKEFDNEDIPKEFDIAPRPPTPPKDLNDDEYQPEVLNLGPPPASHHFSTSESHKPILKTAYQHDKAWVDFRTINPKVMDILYWRDPKKSGIAFSLSLLALLLLTKLSIISLFAYASLLILTTTLGFRLFKTFEAKFKSGDTGNPFDAYFNEQLTIPGDKVHAQVDVIVEQLQKGLVKLQKLFLIENMCESIKFVGICWALTYIGGWFSMLGLSFILVIGAFTLPKFYEVYQEPIDAYLKIAKEKIHDIMKQVEEKVPCLSKLCSPCSQNTVPVEPEKKDQ